MDPSVNFGTCPIVRTYQGFRYKSMWLVWPVSMCMHTLIGIIGHCLQAWVFCSNTTTYCTLDTTTLGCMNIFKICLQFQSGWVHPQLRIGSVLPIWLNDIYIHTVYICCVYDWMPFLDSKKFFLHKFEFLLRIRFWIIVFRLPRKFKPHSWGTLRAN